MTVEIKLNCYQLDRGAAKGDNSNKVTACTLNNFLEYVVCHIPTKKTGIDFSFSKVDPKREVLSFPFFLSHLHTDMIHSLEILGLWHRGVSARALISIIMPS